MSPKVITILVLVAIVVFLFSQSLFIVDEKAGKAMAFAQMPTWIVELILPIGFAIIALRYAIYFVIHFIHIIKPPPDTDEEQSEHSSGLSLLDELPGETEKKAEANGEDG